MNVEVNKKTEEVTTFKDEAVIKMELTLKEAAIICLAMSDQGRVNLVNKYKKFTSMDSTVEEFKRLLTLFSQNESNLYEELNCFNSLFNQIAKEIAR